MKKIIIITSAIILVILGVLFWQLYLRDILLSRRLVGTWMHKNSSSEVVFRMTLLPNGSFVSVIGGTNALITYQGTWRIKNQTLISTITNEQHVGKRATAPIGYSTESKIIHVDNHRLVYKGYSQKIVLDR